MPPKHSTCPAARRPGQSTADSGAVEGRSGYYLPAGGVGLANHVLIEQLAAAGDKGVNLLPSGHATMKIGPSLTIQGPAGPKTVKLAFIRGIVASPVPVWLDEQNKYFGDAGWISVLPVGFESTPTPRRCATCRRRRPPPRSSRSPTGS